MISKVGVQQNRFRPEDGIERFAQSPEDGLLAGDGDPQPVAEDRDFGKGANGDPQARQGVSDPDGVIEADQHEIALRRRHLAAAALQRLRKRAAAGAHLADERLDVLPPVLQHVRDDRHRQRRDRIRMADRPQVLDDIGGPRRPADPQTGQAPRLGEAANDDRVRKRQRRVGQVVVGELAVGQVHHQQHRRRLSPQASKVLDRGDQAGGVIRRDHNDHGRPLRDGGEHLIDR